MAPLEGAALGRGDGRAGCLKRHNRLATSEDIANLYRVAQKLNAALWSERLLSAMKLEAGKGVAVAAFVNVHKPKDLIDYW